MIITIQIDTPRMVHMQPAQYGAFVAHCMKLEGFYSIEIPNEIQANRFICVSFKIPDYEVRLIDGGKLTVLLQETIDALGNLDPFPCPCGCGAFIAISPCLRQTGEVQNNELTLEEMALVRKGELIAAIKSVRARHKGPPDAHGNYTSAMSLKDAKDMVDHYRDTLTDF